LGDMCEVEVGNAADPEHQMQETCISEPFNIYYIISNS